jgi:hypothetical protein
MFTHVSFNKRHVLSTGGYSAGSEIREYCTGMLADVL